MNRPTEEFTLYISPDGKKYHFSTHQDKFMYPVAGLGMAPIEYLTQRSPFQHGETLLNFFLQPRVIQLQHRRNAHGRDALWDIRADTINYLRPNRQAANSLTTGVLRKIYPSGEMRDISVLVDAGLVFDPSGGTWDEWSFQDTIRFIAFDPTFFDPTAITNTWYATEIEELEFPIEFPIEFGTGDMREAKTILYTGTWLSYPTFVITGPMTGPLIHNLTTGEIIQVNYIVSSGETVTISLEYGNKSVINNLGTNLIGSISVDSDMATFHLAPDPEAPGGENEIRISGSGVQYGTTQVVMTYNTRFIGI